MRSFAGAVRDAQQAFVLDTRAYTQHCTALCGRIIHYSPYGSGAEGSSDAPRRCAATHAAYATLFSQPPSLAFWLPAAVPSPAPREAPAAAVGPAAQHGQRAGQPQQSAAACSGQAEAAQRAQQAQQSVAAGSGQVEADERARRPHIDIAAIKGEDAPSQPGQPPAAKITFTVRPLHSRSLTASTPERLTDSVYL